MNKLPILPLRDEVVLPNVMQMFDVGRIKSINALKEGLRQEKILVVTQKESSVVDPTESDVYSYGTLATVVQMLDNDNNTYKVLLHGLSRVKISKIKSNKDFLYGYYEELKDIKKDDSQHRQLLTSIQQEYSKYAKRSTKIDSSIVMKVNVSSNIVEVVDVVASSLNIRTDDKLKIIATENVLSRAELVLELLKGELSILEAQKNIENTIKSGIEEAQRRYYLEEQKRAIEKELGDGEEDLDETEELKRRIDNTKLPPEAKKKVDREFKRLKQMQPMGADAGVIRNYLDHTLSLPWEKVTSDNYDIVNAEKVLNADHYGMQKVKDRILEQIAVFAATKGTKGSVICLAGSPGTGKTTIAQSIAKALGREFIKISLGGVSDESEIRGHRRTYVGSMPGKIISAFKKSGSMNPVVLLDEIDKLGKDHRGDPSAAMLEVLDPSQNSKFNDHYLDLDFDLSKCFFVATANYLEKIPAPLRDRMEIIRVDSYLEDEKLNIAKNHLIPKITKDVGLVDRKITFKDNAIVSVIREYTREAGVRSLEKKLSKVLRNVVRHGGTKPVTIDVSYVEEVLGTEKAEFGVIEPSPTVGLVNGMAYSEAGGDLLQVEAVKTFGKGAISVTGSLGDVMRESSNVAFTCAKQFIKPEQLDKKDIHIHFPDGATPKDGPSAGIALVTAIVSCLTDTPVKNTLSMTGEVTIRGKVLAIGGVKEKVISAHRGGVKEIILPKANKKDIKDIPTNIAKQLKFYFVEDVKDVLKLALVKKGKVRAKK